MPQIIPIRNLKNTAEISEMCHTTDEPIFVTKNGYGDMVIMSMKVYEENMAIWDMMKKIAAAEKEVEENHVSDARQNLRHLKEKI